MFRMAKALRFEAATQDRNLLDALEAVLANEHRKVEWIADDLTLSFASERWRKLVRRSHGLGHPTNRRYLEVCVFSYLSGDLRSGDVCIEGSESFADYRAQLLPWNECEALLPTYCDRIGIPAAAGDFVDGLKQLLTETAAKVDEEFPQHAGDVVIGSTGEPTLRRVAAREVPASAIALHAAIENRTVPRNLLDVLAKIEHWTGFTRNFGPQSGDDPKLRNARDQNSHRQMVRGELVHLDYFFVIQMEGDLRARFLEYSRAGQQAGIAGLAVNSVGQRNSRN